MIVQVLFDFKDKENRNILRVAGSFLDIEDKKRAEELIQKGAIREIKPIIVKKEDKKATKK